MGDRAGREDASDGGPGGRWRVHSCAYSSGEPAARGGGDTGGRAPGRAAGEACIGCAFDTVYGDDATGAAHWAGCDRWLHSTALFTNLGLSWQDEPVGVRKRRVWPELPPCAGPAGRGPCDGTNGQPQCEYNRLVVCCWVW